MEMLSEFGAVPVQVDFWVDSLSLPYRFRRHFYRREGWLQAVRCKLDTFVSSHEKTVLAACNEQGEIISEWYASRLLDMECGIPKEAYFDPPPELEDISDALYWDFLGTCDLQNLRMLRALESDTEQQLDDLSSRADAIFEDAETYVSTIRRKMRSPDCAPENRRHYRDQIELVEDKLTSAMRWVRSQMDDIRHASARTERDILDSLTVHGEKEALFTVHWRTRSNWRQIRIDFPLQLTERPNPGIDVNSETAQSAAVALGRELFERRKRYQATEDADHTTVAEKADPGDRNATNSSGILERISGPLIGNMRDNPDFIPASEAEEIYRKGHSERDTDIDDGDEAQPVENLPNTTQSFEHVEGDETAQDKGDDTSASIPKDGLDEDAVTSSNSNDENFGKGQKTEQVRALQNKVAIYLYGTCSDHSNAGGWGAILRFGEHRKNLNGGAVSTTEERMNLTALIEALKILNRPCAIDLYTASISQCEGLENGLERWKRQDWQSSTREQVDNADLWKAFDALQEKHNLTWHWVENAHTNEESRDVNLLARDGMAQHD
jgi:ribonuclease HI